MIKDLEDSWLTPALLVITPATCRAARALLNIRQLDLSSGALVSLSAVRRFESGADTSQRQIQIASQSYLERAGIEFIVDNDFAVGVRQRLIAPAKRVVVR